MQLFTNNAVSSLASGVNATDNTIVLVAGEGAKFPAITGGDFFLLTLTQGVGLESSWEIVKCTARSGDSLTVVRAQEGTAGQIWAAGSKVDLRVTAGTLDAKVTGQSSSVDGEIALFSGTGGKTIKRSALDGIIKSAAGVASTAVAGTDYVAPEVATTFTAQQTFKEVKDTVYAITDGNFAIDPGNGSIQTVTISAGRTPTAANFEAGQIVLLGIQGNFTITWSSVAVTWIKAGGTASAPNAAASGYLWVMLWKVGTTIYGTEVGKK